jgi:DNA-binding transcriptional regulator LsrR (DeoR family)
MPAIDEKRLLTKIAHLYHEQNMKQSEIAAMLSLSQSQVSRALSRCIKEGIVKISVIPPANIYTNLEMQIQNLFGLRHVVVVDVQDYASKEQINFTIGSATAHYLETVLKSDQLVGISSWSTTIKAMIDQLHPISIKAKGVIQLLGGIGQNGNVQATIITQQLANMLHCPAFLLPAQSVGQSLQSYQAQVTSEDVRKVLDMFPEVDISIVGIGALEPSDMLKLSGNSYPQEELQRMEALHAVGECCLHYYDRNGQAVLHEDEDPALGMHLSQLKDCPRVIAMAGGLHKVEAIIGALKSGFIDVLFIDNITGKEILKQQL